MFVDAGLSPEEVYLGKHGIELPGFFRPEKSWDVLADESFAEPDEEMTWAKFEAAIRGKVKEALA